MLKRLVYIILVGLIALPAFANNLVGDKVVLRALDKVTATTEDYTVKVGEHLRYGSLDIKVQHCEKRPPEETPETFVFLQISEARRNSGTGDTGDTDGTNSTGDDSEMATLFSGWMFASSPALSALDHPVYDIWVLDCLTDPANSTSENP